MLRQRVITALVLLAILLPALFYPQQWPFAVVVLVLMSAGAWEWARLNGLQGVAAIAFGAVCAIACVVGWRFESSDTSFWRWVWTFAALGWVLGGAALLRVGVDGWPRIAASVRLIAGLVILWLAAMAVLQLRERGVVFLLSAMALVWMADIAAYFAGRAFGQRWFKQKLAPSISPGKSWEGALGGLLAVSLMAWASVLWAGYVDGSSPSLFSEWARQVPWWVFMPAVWLMVAMSVVGDLAESLVKRAAGVKDSSGLLPGHGGVLDRVDALLPTLPLAMAFTIWMTA